MKTNIFPPPIYRLDKINSYIKAKLDDYLRDSKEMSKGAFEKTIFMRMFFENELEESKILLSQVGQTNRPENLDPYSMSLARSGDSYVKDHESIHREKEFFKFYIISLQRHLETLEKSLNKIQPEAVKTDVIKVSLKEENVFCRTMPLNIPKEHFEILTTAQSKNGKPFLTQDQFDNFINRAFLGRIDLPMQKFNQAPKELSKIKYLFKQFHQNYSFDYFGTDQKQEVFIKLLTDNFIGWEFKKVHANFNKIPKNTL